jgi:hypothetical protein
MSVGDHPSLERSGMRPSRRPKKDVHDLIWELFEAIEDVQLCWNALDVQEKFDRTVTRIRNQYERLKP